MPHAAEYLELSFRYSVEVRVNPILSQTMVLRPVVNDPPLTGDTNKKPKINPEGKRMLESAMIRYRAGFRPDCTQSADLL